MQVLQEQKPVTPLTHVHVGDAAMRRCKRAIRLDRFIAPAKPALPPSMEVVAWLTK